MGYCTISLMRNHLYECEGITSIRMINAKFSKVLMKLSDDAQDQNRHNRKNRFCDWGKFYVIIIILVHTSGWTIQGIMSTDYLVILDSFS